MIARPAGIAGRIRAPAASTRERVPRWLLVVAALATLPAHAARNPPPTVATVAESNGLSSNGYLVVQTPSILRVEVTEPLPPDPRAAIEQYDRLLALNPDPLTRAESRRRASDLRVQLAEAEQSAGNAFHVSEVRRAIADYQRILVEDPGYGQNDRVLYQLARAYQIVGEVEPAILALRQLGTRYPQSARAADAHFRAAEWLFARSRWREAEPAYAALLAMGPEAPYYEIAQYKYGWSLYKQSSYEQAADVFIAILDRDLVAGDQENADQAIATVAPDKAERATESLRVLGLSFAALGGGPALNAHFARSRVGSRLETLIYASLGSALLDKQRFTDAAGTFMAFIERHPDHARAPQFQDRTIATFQQAGMVDLAIRAQETYATRYAPDSSYWAQRTPDPRVMSEVRRHLDELGRGWQARAQQTREQAPRQASYLAAAGWYRRLVELFPQDATIAETHMLLADALLEGGRSADAARQYEHTAYGITAHARAPVAAIAAVQAWQRQVRDAPEGEARMTARRASIVASLKLADHFPAHPQRTAVLMAAAEDQFELGALDEAIASADRVLQAQPAPADELRRGALGVIADSRFAQKKYPEAEAAYTRLLPLAASAGNEERRRLAIEQLAASIYKQAEAARAAGDLKLATTHFERVGRVAPEASIRASSDYDAASTLVLLEDWPRAGVALEDFRGRHSGHRLLADVDKKLALAYEKNAKPALAAAVHTRIALREEETGAIRRAAAWTSAQLYDQARLPAETWRAYQFYVSSYPQPLDPAMQARQRLSQLALSHLNDPSAHRHWLDQIVLADQSAGDARSEVSRRLAAESSLSIGRLDAGSARQIAIEAPLKESLARRRTATEISIATLERAAAYGYADITSAATYELASVYVELGRAVLDSERPQRLSGDALEQYQVLLEEQAFPFEEKGIKAHETNLARLRAGIWNDSIARSVTALGELSPARYGKQEKRETTYDTLH
ncbi:MAG: tetratricopeptide repeat protein [Panacagrimonas sp.]